jgi:hypothetical protein
MHPCFSSPVKLNVRVGESFLAQPRIFCRPLGDDKAGLALQRYRMTLDLAGGYLSRHSCTSLTSSEYLNGFSSVRVAPSAPAFAR